MFNKYYASKNHLESAQAGVAFSILGFIFASMFLGSGVLLIALLILIGSRILAWQKWLVLIKSKQNLLLPSYVMSLVAVVFIVWESFIYTMGFNVIMMVFCMIAATEGLILAAIGGLYASRPTQNYMACMLAVVLLLYAMLMLLTGNVPFGP